MFAKRLKAAASLIALMGGAGVASTAVAQDCASSQMLTSESELIAEMSAYDAAEARLSYRVNSGGKSIIVGVQDAMSLNGSVDAFSPTEGQAFIVVSPEEGWGDETSSLLTIIADGAEFLAWDYELMATGEGSSPDTVVANAILAGRSFQVKVEQGDGSDIVQGFRFSPSLATADVNAATNAALQLKRTFDAGECSLPEDFDDEYYGYGCFLTTASVEVVGLDDDCWELRTLRGFRDGFLSRFDAGRDLVQDYYVRAPRIVERISARPDGRAIWLKTYFGGILPSAVAARLGLNGLALKLYRRMTERLEALAA